MKTRGYLQLLTNSLRSRQQINFLDIIVIIFLLVTWQFWVSGMNIKKFEVKNQCLNTFQEYRSTGLHQIQLPILYSASLKYNNVVIFPTSSGAGYFSSVFQSSLNHLNLHPLQFSGVCFYHSFCRMLHIFYTGQRKIQESYVRHTPSFHCRHPRILYPWLFPARFSGVNRPLD